MRAFARYRVMLIENGDLRKDIHQLDEKINKVFKYLLDRIDEMHQKKLSIKPNKVGYKSFEEDA